jgi:hypothetical protein
MAAPSLPADTTLSLRPSSSVQIRDFGIQKALGTLDSVVFR